MDIGIWAAELGAAVMVCDERGVILSMNQKAARTYARDGGMDLVGRNVLDCHPEKARNKLARMLEDRTANSYTIEKNGVKKLIHQAPWFENGEYGGFVEISIEIPFDMPHFVRKPA